MSDYNDERGEPSQAFLYQRYGDPEMLVLENVPGDAGRGLSRRQFLSVAGLGVLALRHYPGVLVQRRPAGPRGAAGRALGAGWQPAPFHPRTGVTSPFTGLRAYTNAMHVHASSSEQEGSWLGQANLAAAAGVDVLWMTDHDHRMGNSPLIVNGLSLRKASESGCSLQRLSGSSSIGANGLTIVNGTVQVSDPSRRIGRNLQHLTIGVTGSGPFQIHVVSSEKPYANTPEKLVTAVLDVPHPNPSQPVTFQPVNLLMALAKYPWEANDFAMYHLQFVTTGKTTLHDLTLDWGVLGTRPLLDQRAMRDQLVQLYPGLTIPQGEELSFEVLPLKKHYGWYGPEDQLAFLDFYALQKMTAAQASPYEVGFVHDRSGIVSLNHPYGANGYGSAPKTPTQLQAIAAGLLAGNVDGVDIIELGYYSRGGAALERDFLQRLGDNLWANSVTRTVGGSTYFLPMNGATDDHHAKNLVKLNNNWATDVYAPDNSVASITAALQRAQCAIRSMSWGGIIDVQAGDYRGGQYVALPSGASCPAVQVYANKIPTGGWVNAVQGRIRNDGKIATTPTSTIAAFRESGGVVNARVANPVGSFTRFVVRRSDGTIIGASQPTGFVSS